MNIFSRRTRPRRKGSDAPFGTAPQASAEEYLAFWEEAKAESHPFMDSLVNELGYAPDPDWLDALALQTQVVVKKSRLNWQHGRLLYAALRARLSDHSENRPIKILETGTARGYSAVVMARALIDADAEGTVLTVDMLPHNTRFYWNCIADHSGPQTREELLAGYPKETARIIFLEGALPDKLQRIGLDRIDFAFIDASHTYEDVMQEFSFIEARQHKGDMIVFDDVSPNQFPGVVQALDSISHTGQYAVKKISDGGERGYALARRN